MGRWLTLFQFQGPHAESEDSNIDITGLPKNQVRSRGQALAHSLAKKSAREMQAISKQEAKVVRIYPEGLNLAGSWKKNICPELLQCKPCCKEALGQPLRWGRHPFGDKVGCSGKDGPPSSGSRKGSCDLRGPGARAWRVQGHSTSILAERRTKYRKELGKGKEKSHLRSKWGRRLWGAGREDRG